MRVIERHSQDTSDAAHSVAFRVRLEPISTFVRDMNTHLAPKVDLLAVRDGTKFDFVLKDVAGKVIGVMMPMMSAGAVSGMHIEMTGMRHASGDFGIDDTASAAEFVATASPISKVETSALANRR